MKNKLNSIKNMIWAASIVLCLLALFVALIVAAVSPYSGPMERGGVQLNQSSQSGAGEEERPDDGGDGSLYALGEGADAGQGP